MKEERHLLDDNGQLLDGGVVVTECDRVRIEVARDGKPVALIVVRDAEPLSDIPRDAVIHSLEMPRSKILHGVVIVGSFKDTDLAEALHQLALKHQQTVEQFPLPTEVLDRFAEVAAEGLTEVEVLCAALDAWLEANEEDLSRSSFFTPSQ